RIVSAQVDVFGAMAVRAPVPLVLTRLRVVDDDAVVAVAVGYIDFVGYFVDEGFRRQPQVLGVVAALALSRFADLHQKLAVVRELQDHRVVEIALDAAGLTLVEHVAAGDAALSAAGAAASRRRAAAVAADPDIAFVVDRHAVVRLGPVIARAWT